MPALVGLARSLSGMPSETEPADRLLVLLCYKRK